MPAGICLRCHKGPRGVGKIEHEPWHRACFTMVRKLRDAALKAEADRSSTTLAGNVFAAASTVEFGRRWRGIWIDRTTNVIVYECLAVFGSTHAARTNARDEYDRAWPLAHGGRMRSWTPRRIGR